MSSDVVRDACNWCGGPVMIVYATDHGHATWCPTHNEEYAAILSPRNSYLLRGVRHLRNEGWTVAAIASYFELSESLVAAWLSVPTREESRALARVT